MDQASILEIDLVLDNGGSIVRIRFFSASRL
jgi:hypothetical protein